MILKRFVIIFMTAVSLSACSLPVRLTEVRGSGNMVTESRRVSGFNAVELSGMGTLIITQGEKEELEITAEENLIKHLRSDVSGSRLILGVDDNVTILPGRDIIYRLTVINIKQIKSSGLGKIELNKLEADDLSIEVSGSGRVSVDNLAAQTLALKISGLGDISANGKATEMQVGISGAGKVDAPNLESRVAKVEISGTGNAILWVTDSLDVELSGLGQVQYYGNPVMKSEISGAGNVKNLGGK